MVEGILRVDLHGKNAYKAKVAIDTALRRSKGVYRIRLIHGYRGGTALREMIWKNYSSHPEILRLEVISEGVTDMVLREF